MHIDDDHRHYGSALIQIAEDPHFTAINALQFKGRNSRCGFRVNKDIGVYIRYRGGPQGVRIPIYSFNFSQDNLAELRRMRKRLEKVFLALVCVEDREICCLPCGYFEELVSARKAQQGWEEAEYVIEVRIPQGKRCRVGISPPGTKGTWLRSFIIPRNSFPCTLFDRSNGRPGVTAGRARSQP
jgi:hypothetical protein